MIEPSERRKRLRDDGHGENLMLEKFWEWLYFRSSLRVAREARQRLDAKRREETVARIRRLELEAELSERRHHDSYRRRHSGA